MKLIHIFLIAIASLLIGCNSAVENTETEEPTEQPSESLLPIIDSVYIHQKVSMADSFLAAADVLKFSKVYMKIPESVYYTPEFNGFLTIDSIRNAGEYQSYVEHLDIGMLREAAALYLENIKIDKESGIYVWCIKYSSFEACPYYEGTEVFGTFYNKDGIQRTHLLGLLTNASDPPAGLETYLHSTPKGKGYFSQFISKEIDIDKKETVTHTEERNWEANL